MLDIVSRLVHMWNCGNLKPNLWDVADSEVKGVVSGEAMFSWFSLGSDSILWTAPTGMADKITVCPMLELWEFRNCLQQFATRQAEINAGLL